MDKKQKALSLFSNHYNCAQSVFTAFAPGHGLSEETALKTACAFGAGMARTQGICGAVTGAFMVIGLRHGKYLADDQTGKDITYDKAREFAGAFTRLHGSTVCRELIGIDISTQDGLLRALDADLFESRCAVFVRDAVALLEEID